MNTPIKIEAKDCDPGESGDEDEVAVVADDGADVILDELADGGGGGAVEEEAARLGEVGEEEEAAEEGGEGDVDEDNLALEVLVTWEEPVDNECEHKAEKADDGADGEKDESNFGTLVDVFVTILRLGDHNF